MPTLTLCPYCAESVSDDAQKCPYCAEWFDRRPCHVGSLEWRAAVHAGALVSRRAARRGADVLGALLFVPFWVGGLVAGFCAVWRGNSLWLGFAVPLLIWWAGWAWSNRVSNP